MPVSKDVARDRGKVGGLKRAVKTGERPPNDPAIPAAERDLAVTLLAEHAARVVEKWPALSDEQIGRVATILRGGGD